MPSKQINGSSDNSEECNSFESNTNNVTKRPRSYRKLTGVNAYGENMQEMVDSYSDDDRKTWGATKKEDIQQLLQHSQHHHQQDNVIISPSTPPLTMQHKRSPKRRKGIPHRAPMGV